MPRRVKGPDGVIHNFPDDASDAEVSAALGAMLAGSKQATSQPLARKGRTWTDTAVDALPAIAGAVGGVVGGLGGTVAGLGVGGVPGAIGGAALGGAAGESARQLVNRARGAEAPESMGQAAASIGTQGAVQGASQAVGAGLGAGAKAGGQWLMQSALKPTISTLKEYGTTGPRVVKTLLDEGVSVTEGGLAKLQRLLSATNAEIRAAVQSAPGSIEKTNVAARVLPTAAKVSQQVNPSDDLAAVGRTVTDFMDHPVVSGPRMSVPEAQAMKVGTYEQIGKKYGEVSSATIQTQKALARGLKEEIAAEVPGIAAMNARDSALMAAADATGRRVALSGNKDPVGFAWVTQNPTTFLAALIDRNPAVKSFVARGLYQTAGALSKVSPQLIRAAVVALTTSESGGGPARE